ncbi:MAG TPA: phosphatidylglycerophosphatase A [Acidobacteriaceae bacterium]|nr:phosphatidylglycerophosphatase A [Acidobacteriaceae bacterium]
MNSRTATDSPVRKTLWAWTVGTWFGVGLMRPGPGTWGSAAAALLWLLAGATLPHSPLPLSLLTLAAAFLAVAIGVPAATRVELESARPDPEHVVVDEVAGQWIALIHSRVDLSHLLAAFLLFRFFDILKPWPARRLERLPAGWGIMFDDVAAGVYALLVVQALQYWIGR